MKKMSIILCLSVFLVMSLISCAKKEESAKSPSAPSVTCEYSFGYNEDYTNNFWSGGYLLAYGFTMSSDVVVSKIALNFEYESDYVVGIFTDSSGAPHTRLAQSAITSGAVGLNSAAIPATTLTSGTKYWLVFSTKINTARGDSNADAVCKYNNYPWVDIESGGGLPASYTTWQTDDTDGDIKIYAMTCN